MKSWTDSAQASKNKQNQWRPLQDRSELEEGVQLVWSNDGLLALALIPSVKKILVANFLFKIRKSRAHPFEGVIRKHCRWIKFNVSKPKLRPYLSEWPLLRPFEAFVAKSSILSGVRLVCHSAYAKLLQSFGYNVTKFSFPHCYIWNASSFAWLLVSRPFINRCRCLKVGSMETFKWRSQARTKVFLERTESYP